MFFERLFRPGQPKQNSTLPWEATDSNTTEIQCWSDDNHCMKANTSDLDDAISERRASSAGCVFVPVPDSSIHDSSMTNRMSMDATDQSSSFKSYYFHRGAGAVSAFSQPQSPVTALNGSHDHRFPSVPDVQDMSLQEAKEYLRRRYKHPKMPRIELTRSLSVNLNSAERPKKRYTRALDGHEAIKKFTLQHVNRQQGLLHKVMNSRSNVHRVGVDSSSHADLCNINSSSSSCSGKNALNSSSHTLPLYPQQQQQQQARSRARSRSLGDTKVFSSSKKDANNLAHSKSLEESSENNSSDCGISLDSCAAVHYGFNSVKCSGGSNSNKSHLQASEKSVITPSKVRYSRAEAVAAFVADALKERSIEEPQVLLGWEILILSSETKYIGAMVVTSMRRNWLRQVEFLLSSPDGPDIWVALRRSKNQTSSVNFTAVRKVLGSNA